jgi:CubicO group peptidase (beta-lactamase class C family)
MRTLIAALALFTAVANAQTVSGANWQQLASRAQAGWQQKDIDTITREIASLGSTSALIIQHGLVIAAWGDIAHRSDLHSCRKSLLSALIGIAVANNQIHLDDTLAQLNIDDNKPSLTAVEKQATVRDLLEARSGVYHPTDDETQSMLDKKPPRGSHPPGTFWYYNNWDFNTLGTIYEHSTGNKIFSAFYNEIAQPIGMQDFRPKDGHYITSKESRFPAYPFDMSARDLARFALLYLHGGNWNGVQVVPADWVKASIQPYSNTESGGYGYLWWTADSLTHATPEYRFPKGSFWLEGHLGQYAVVIPSLDLIIVNRIDGDKTKHTVDKRQMAHLVHTIVSVTPK